MQNPVTFDDVAGVDEAKEELKEIVVRSGCYGLRKVAVWSHLAQGLELKGAGRWLECRAVWVGPRT